MTDTAKVVPETTIASRHNNTVRVVRMQDLNKLFVDHFIEDEQPFVRFLYGGVWMEFSTHVLEEFMNRLSAESCAAQGELIIARQEGDQKVESDT